VILTRAEYAYVNLYRLKSSPAVVYAFACKSAAQARERQDQRNADLIYIRTARVKVS
jgi:hypothetical protein